MYLGHDEHNSKQERKCSFVNWSKSNKRDGNTSCINPQPKSGLLKRSQGEVKSICSIISRIWPNWRTQQQKFGVVKRCGLGRIKGREKVNKAIIGSCS
jgi:hypothetical protein